jgi:hypothetical protein
VAGSLVAGDAVVLIDEKNAVSAPVVSCQSMPWFTIVTIGDEATGVTAYVSNGERLSADWVDIRNLGGFTGSYNPGHDGHDGEAVVDMNAATYVINGTARGYYAANPSVTTTERFAIKVSC